MLGEIMVIITTVLRNADRYCYIVEFSFFVSPPTSSWLSAEADV